MDRAGQAYFLRIFWALFRLLIFFLRHFQRCLPRFFQALELLFMGQSPSCLLAYTASFLYAFWQVRRACREFRPLVAAFEPETTGLEGQCYILTKPPAHLALVYMKDSSIKPWEVKIRVLRVFSLTNSVKFYILRLS